MGTRSNIAVEQPNGEVVVTYCHWDGYPTYNGQMLNDHYNNHSKANELVNQGYISGLKETVAKSIEDRANIQPPMKYASLNAFIKDISWDIEYAYIYSHNQWYCNDDNLMNIDPDTFEIDKSNQLKVSHFEPLWSVLIKHTKQEESA